MIRKKINEWQDRMDAGLRRMCGRLTPGKQLAVTLVMLLGCAVYLLHCFGYLPDGKARG